MGLDKKQWQQTRINSKTEISTSCWKSTDGVCLRRKCMYFTSKSVWKTITNFCTIAPFVLITLGLLASLLHLFLHLAMFPCLLSWCQSLCPAPCSALGFDGLWAFSGVTFNTCIHIAFPPPLEILILSISDTELAQFCSLGAEPP